MSKKPEDKASEDGMISADNDIEFFHNFGLNIKTRTIYFGAAEYMHESGEENGIDWKVAERTIKNLHILSKMSRATINIVCHSFGGDVYAALAIYDMMQSIPNKIVMTAYGTCMSAATIVMQGADVRCLSRNSRFMIHDGFVSFNGKNDDYEKYAGENNILKNTMHSIYYEHAMKAGSSITLEEIRDNSKTDWYMSAEEALENGFIDKVV